MYVCRSVQTGQRKTTLARGGENKVKITKAIPTALLIASTATGLSACGTTPQGFNNTTTLQADLSNKILDPADSLYAGDDLTVMPAHYDYTSGAQIPATASLTDQLQSITITCKNHLQTTKLCTIVYPNWNDLVDTTIGTIPNMEMDNWDVTVSADGTSYTVNDADNNVIGDGTSKTTKIGHRIYRPRLLRSHWILRSIARNALRGSTRSYSSNTTGS